MAKTKNTTAPGSTSPTRRAALGTGFAAVLTGGTAAAARVTGEQGIGGAVAGAVERYRRACARLRRAEGKAGAIESALPDGDLELPSVQVGMVRSSKGDRPRFAYTDQEIGDYFDRFVIEGYTSPKRVAAMEMRKAAAREALTASQARYEAVARASGLASANAECDAAREEQGDAVAALVSAPVHTLAEARDKFSELLRYEREFNGLGHFKGHEGAPGAEEPGDTLALAAALIAEPEAARAA